MGAQLPHDPRKRVFVIEGTRAWEAQLDERQRRTGIRSSPVTTAIIDGKARRGWYFESLFPQREAVATGPPVQPTMTQDDHDQVANL